MLGAGAGTRIGCDAHRVVVYTEGVRNAQDGGALHKGGGNTYNTCTNWDRAWRVPKEYRRSRIGIPSKGACFACVCNYTNR